MSIEVKSQRRPLEVTQKDVEQFEQESPLNEIAARAALKLGFWKLREASS